MVMLPLLFAACVAPMLCGYISDQLGGRRKPLVYFAGFLMIVCNICLAFVRTWKYIPYIGFVFGAVRAL